MSAPLPPTALVGRRAELEQLRELLEEGVRLVTLTGPGGVGKTRLALAVLGEFESRYGDGAVFVPLASLADPALVPSAIAQALGLREAGGQPLAETLAAFLLQRELLLCLDNLEHLLEAAPFVSGLLGASPGLTVLATSRAPLRLAGEQEFPVPPLAEDEAVELFAARGRAVRPRFVLDEGTRNAVASICARLDDLPLAIELAAARLRALSLEKLEERLSERLSLLTSGPRDAPARQQTLRATIEWSYSLLSEDEQTLLARLSIFAGGAALEAAEAVSGAELDTLASLVEQSLVREDDGRYSMLETIREYALARLAERGEEAELRQRHAEFFLALAEEADRPLRGPDQVRWLRRLEADLDNLRAALSWAIEEDVERALRLRRALWYPWHMRGRVDEGLRRISAVLSAAGGRFPALEAWARIGGGVLAAERGEIERARTWHEEALAILSQHGDRHGIVLAIQSLGGDLILAGRHEDAVTTLTRAIELAREESDAHDLAMSINNLGNAYLERGDPARAAELFAESLGLFEALGDRWGVSFALHNLGCCANDLGEHARSVELHHQALEAFLEIEDVIGFRDSFDELARAHLGLGDVSRAAVLFGAARAAAELVGTEHPMSNRLEGETQLRAALGDQTFERLLAEGRAMTVDEALDYALARQGKAAAAAPTQRVDPGSTLAGFELLELIGRGGMGVVYRARQVSLERTVALKLLSPALAEDVGFRERFLREARLAASLEHPNVLTVHEAGEFEGRLFLAMRYVEGTDLGSVLAEGPLEPRRAVAIVNQVASALDAAHAKGLVHRDVKPQNVLLEGVHAYLCDFGLAKSAGGETAGLTRTGQLLGTMDYVAPETVQTGEAGPASDLYALACVLYQALTGEAPFPRESDVAKLWAHVHDEPPALGPGLPAAFDDVVRRGLAKRPEERFASAGELARAAREALEGSATALPKPVREWPATLPRPATSLIGRERELVELADLLARDDVRLVTLTGPGGGGKTRLALELAARLSGRFADGARFLDLSALTDPGLVASTVARGLGLSEAGGTSPEGLLTNYLTQRDLLLCLDNLEQLVPAAPLLSTLLSAAAGLRILSTSRVPLRLSTEHEYRVPSLAEAESISLFEARATDVQGDTTAVAEICTRLDGLPLAIELAAARTKLLSPIQILERLDQRLELLTGGARDIPLRQQTLRATLDWSHELLDPRAQALLAHLAVFVGGFTLEAAEAVCDAELDTLDALHEASLLRRREGRFHLLETVHLYAGERLRDRGEDGEYRRRYAEFFLSLAEEAEPELRRPAPAEWLDRLEEEHDNFRAALNWLLAVGESELALRLAFALGEFWLIRGYLSQGRELLERVLTETEGAEPMLRARVLYWLSTLTTSHGEYARGRALAEKSLEVCRANGSTLDVALGQNALGIATVCLGDLDRASEFWEEALILFRNLGDTPGERAALHFLGEVARDRAEFASARAMLERSLELSLELGEGVYAAMTMHSLGDLALDQRELESAEASYLRSLTALRPLRSGHGIANCLAGLAAVAACSGKDTRAARVWHAVTAYEEATGNPLFGHERARYERALTDVELPAGEPALSLDEAVAYALGEESA